MVLPTQHMSINILTIATCGSLIVTKYARYTYLLANAHIYVQKELKKTKEQLENANHYSSKLITQKLAMDPEAVEYLYHYILQNKNTIEALVDNYNQMKANGIKNINPNIEGLIYLTENSPSENTFKN